jgi:lipopolysaccharide/colanic/teichoic acid biosynthesis glycosyltransferase
MTIADESLFKRLLLLERRRAERSGTRFALMLVDMEELGSKINAGTMEEIGRAIGSTMRETDVTGWYRNSAVLGVILTTLNGAGRQTLESVVIERTRAILSRHSAAAGAEHVWISCHIFPDDENVARKPTDRKFSAGLNGDEPEGRRTTLKRVVDVSGSVVALLLLSPVFFSIAALIKATSKGPVFFKQRRIGQAGKEFTFLKFRSMHVNNDPAIHQEYVRKLISQELTEADGTYKIKNDPRVTAIGRLLRKSSLDELPQFINVLKGDMSLVGPRPPIPYEFENYSLWHRRRILEAKPGLTGVWQVSGRSRTTFDEMVRMDLRYIREQCLWLDVKILFKTPLAVLKGDGAY